jgi:hypothetical protein
MKTKEEIEQLAKDYAETFRLKTQKTGWYFEKIEDYTKGYTQCQEDMAKSNDKLIDSMAMRYRHDFGLLDKQQQDSIRTTMIQLWEEVVGKGFYKY